MSNRTSPTTHDQAHPLSARIAAGLRQVDVASRSGVSLQTVLRCEKSGRWPKSLPLRAAYLAALGLPAAAPAKPKPKPPRRAGVVS